MDIKKAEAQMKPCKRCQQKPKIVQIVRLFYARCLCHVSNGYYTIEEAVTAFNKRNNE